MGIICVKAVRRRQCERESRTSGFEFRSRAMSRWIPFLRSQHAEAPEAATDAEKSELPVGSKGESTDDADTSGRTPGEVKNTAEDLKPSDSDGFEVEKEDARCGEPINLH
ncbi:hypothetical protein BS47DRAFT_545869 [Hydnum rufescens UP504]|uniref:Uncharacterized protein n=1 Tax=Hydnum rufescens UP504 TaxID=1448309 RepID=A0A9P6B3X0_9AGAM|nr:hypothetical protein BS47DRAFT_545869 [Hydnum rufescens UP504]